MGIFLHAKLRTGHVVIFVCDNGKMEVGLVTSVWKSGKKKRLVIAPCFLECCHAFRIAQLQPSESKDKYVVYFSTFFF